MHSITSKTDRYIYLFSGPFVFFWGCKPINYVEDEPFIAFLVLTLMKRSTYLCVHCKQYSYRMRCFRLKYIHTVSEVITHTSKDSSLLVVDPPSRVYDSMCDAGIFCYWKGPVRTQRGSVTVPTI